VSASKLKNQIGVILLDKPMSLKEVAEALEVKDKKAYSLLKSMFKKDRVAGFKDTDGVRRYRVTEEEAEKAAKRKARAEKKAAKAK
jgi:predicted transcriptional regulator